MSTKHRMAPDKGSAQSFVVRSEDISQHYECGTLRRSRAEDKDWHIQLTGLP